MVKKATGSSKEPKMNDSDARINRLMGQIEGIRRMINGGRKAEDVVQQIMAAKQALSRVALLQVKKELIEGSGKNAKRMESLLEKVFKV